VIVMGPKLPAAVVPASAWSVVSTKRSTPSEAPNPVPDTVTAVPGGPVVGLSSTWGVTVKAAGLFPVPAGW
jgi:hypothetical protein